MDRRSLRTRIPELDSFVLHGPESGYGWNEADAEVWEAMRQQRDAGNATALAARVPSAGRPATAHGLSPWPPCLALLRADGRWSSLVSFLTRLRRWVRGGAAVLDPHESDVRAIAPEPDSVHLVARPKTPPSEPAEEEHWPGAGG